MKPYIVEPLSAAVCLQHHRNDSVLEGSEMYTNVELTEIERLDAVLIEVFTYIYDKVKV